MRSATETVQAFWLAMASNDFSSVAPLLADAFYLEWPQTKERITGAAKFVQMNQEYVAHGRWQFDIKRFVANDAAGEVVTETAINDGVQFALAISFFKVANGKIVSLREFWPEDAEGKADRKHLLDDATSA